MSPLDDRVLGSRRVSGAFEPGSRSVSTPKLTLVGSGHYQCYGV